MIFKGIVHKKAQGEVDHVVEVPMLDLMTQGKDPSECVAMAIDAIEALAPDLKGKMETIWVGQSQHSFLIQCDEPRIIALMLQRQRVASGLSVKEAAKKLGFKSHNSISAYEQGEREPTLSKLNQILSAYGKQFEVKVAKAS